MELFLNLLWLTIAVVALITVPRRTGHSLLALGCALALLFPIVSVSDDLLTDREAFEEALAIVVKAVILAVAFVTIARIDPFRVRRVTLLLVHSHDSRPPPRR